MHLREIPTSLEASYPILHILALALFLFPYLLFLISEIALTKSHAVEDSSTTQWLPNIALQQTSSFLKTSIFSHMSSKKL